MKTTFIEKDCIFEHGGRKFESGGAFVAGDKALAYIGSKVGDGMGVDRFGETSRNYLTDWHGNKIGFCLLWKKSYRFNTPGYNIRGTIDGKEFFGWGQGYGMAVKLRAIKRGTI